MNAPALKIQDLTFAYPGSNKNVLSGIDLEIKTGELMCILGANGTGKSTLLGCVCGILTPGKGDIFILGDNITDLPRSEIARRIGYVQQTHVPAFSYTVWQFVMMGRAPRVGFFSRPGKEDEEAVWAALADLGITYLADKPCTDISGGERQLCMIARAVVSRPKILIFDEPTANLDYGNQVRVLKLIRRMSEENYTIIMTTHNPDHALLLEGQVCIMESGEALHTGPADQIITEKTLEKIYNSNPKVIEIKELKRKACLHEKL
jgi:iron complex transport system ATP-binding protein